MSSRSSNSDDDRRLLLGKVTGPRGSSGELTVRVISGDAERWSGLERITIAPRETKGGVEYEVEHGRAYRDRLVLKLREVDDAEAAAGLRGQSVWAEVDQWPSLPEGAHFSQRLVGLAVQESDGRQLGRVVDVLETGGVDVLAVEDDGGNELLIPMAGEFVRSIDDREGRIEVRLAEGLWELNRKEEPR